MRSYLPAYELRRPRDLSEALRVLAAEPGTWRPFAGGTDLMVLLEAGRLPHKRFLSLWELPELRGIAESRAFVTLGALTTYTEVQQHPALRAFPLLCRAAAETGCVATQNRGTLGGNIANASPAADSPPAMLVYDAELELASAQGTRWLPYAGFHTGYKQMAMRPDEVIRRIRLPRDARPWRPYYRKVGGRKAQAISKVCFAGLAHVENGRMIDVRVALASVAPVPLRCAATEASLRGQRLDAGVLRHAREELAREIAPIDDMRSTGLYRSRIAQNLLEDFLRAVSPGELCGPEWHA